MWNSRCRYAVLYSHKRPKKNLNGFEEQLYHNICDPDVIVALLSFLPKNFHSCLIHINKMLERKEGGVLFSGITFAPSVIQEHNLIQTLLHRTVTPVDI